MEDQTTTEGVATPAASRSLAGHGRSLPALAFGALTLALWLALLVGAFVGGTGATIFADILLGTVLLATAGALIAWNRWSVATVIAAAVFVALWAYLGWVLDSFLSDGVYFAIVAAFYLSAPLAAAFALAAGRTRWRAES
jgi:hypothetical protein